MKLEVTAAVAKNEDPFIILGQDVLGGKHSKLRTISHNADYSVITVVDDDQGEIANLHYLKNAETGKLPDAVKLQQQEAAQKPVT